VHPGPAPLKDTSGVMAEDVAKRLIDYGFHAPTLSFPVANTLMVEPTESEPLAELDRFIDAMIAIREEIRQSKPALAAGRQPAEERAPHRRAVGRLAARLQARNAAYPCPPAPQQVLEPVGRVDNVYGDRNLFCSCVPLDAFRSDFQRKFHTT
jgi:glycine dehydrogenase